MAVLMKTAVIPVSVSPFPMKCAAPQECYLYQNLELLLAWKTRLDDLHRRHGTRPPELQSEAPAKERLSIGNQVDAAIAWKFTSPITYASIGKSRLKTVKSGRFRPTGFSEDRLLARSLTHKVKCPH